MPNFLGAVHVLCCYKSLQSSSRLHVAGGLLTLQLHFWLFFVGCFRMYVGKQMIHFYEEKRKKKDCLFVDKYRRKLDIVSCFSAVSWGFKNCLEE